MLENTDRPGLDEQYIMATNASDLTVDPDRTGPADHLIAAGLEGTRMGSILIHLVGEWAAADKPPKLGEQEIVAIAEQLPRLNGKGKLDMKRARAQAIAGRARALRECYLTLTSRGAALAIMGEWAIRRDVDPDLLSPTLYRYLAPACPVCDGLGNMKLPDAPALCKQCPACNGSGVYAVALGGDRVMSWLKACAGKAKAQRGNLMYGRAEVTPMADRLRGEIEPEQSIKVAEAIAAVARESMDNVYKPRKIGP